MAFIDNPEIQIALIAPVFGLIGVIIGLYGPILNERVRAWDEKKRLREGLYRELVNWHEIASYCTKSHDRLIERRFFKPSTFDIRPGALKPVEIGLSILQAESDPQIGRFGLQENLRDLHQIFDMLKEVFLVNNLYSKMLKNVDKMQQFYQMKESYALFEAYYMFLYALSLGFLPYDSVPTSSFLTSEEAKRLCLLEAKLDNLKIAVASFSKMEDDGDLDSRLLNKLRRRELRETMSHAVGEASQTARWCSHCHKYSEPFVLSTIKQFNNEVCGSCGRVLPTIDKLSKQLSSKQFIMRLFKSSSEERRKEAAYALTKNYEYNRTELKEENIDCLINALADQSQDVQKYAATALKNIGTRLEEVTVNSSDRNLKDEAVDKLISYYTANKKNSNARSEAVQAIGAIYYGCKKAHTAKDTLLMAMKSETYPIRKVAAEAIGNIGDSQLLIALEECIDNAKLPMLNTKVIRDPTENSIDSLEKNKDKAAVLGAAVSALGRFCDEVHRDKLLNKLLGILKDTSGRSALPPTVTTVGDYVRGQAAFTLANVGKAAKVRKPLTDVAKDTSANPSLRSAAKQALRWLSPGKL